MNETPCETLTRKAGAGKLGGQVNIPELIAGAGGMKE